MITTETVSFGDGVTAHLAYPARAPQPLPAVIVIQEALGLDDHIRDVAGRIARAGYAALAPDLFAHHGVRPPALTQARIDLVRSTYEGLPRDKLMDPAARIAAMEALPPDDAARAKETAAAMFEAAGNPDAQLPAVIATARFAREELAITRGQKIASIGFCMGGGLSALLAASDPALAGAIVCYGVSPSPAQAAQITCPVLGLYGERDPRVNATIPVLELALGDRFEQHVYAGAGHAFFNDSRGTYDLASARDAWVRVLAFLQSRLG